MPLCPALKTPKGVARNGSIDGAGKSRGSALWLPQLVQKMEGRRVDTMLNLQKGKDKVWLDSEFITYKVALACVRRGEGS